MAKAYIQILEVLILEVLILEVRLQVLILEVLILVVLVFEYWWRVLQWRYALLVSIRLLLLAGLRPC